MILTSPDNKSIVKIDKGELVSYIKNNEELIHQKGEPGWRNSDTEMFPIIGPTETNNFIVKTPKGDCYQDQHGLLRELKYTLIQKNTCEAIFQKEYKASTEISNSKFPEKSTKKTVSWPYHFNFKKIVSLTNDSVKITFIIESEKGMPFMLGYHPAFKLSGSSTEICKTSSEQVQLKKIIGGGSTAYPILNTNEITLVKEKGHNITIKTNGFNNFMLWTEAPNMLCIEPITKYPYAIVPNLFKISNGSEMFHVEIKPFYN